jgi:hypothetical protein
MSLSSIYKSLEKRTFNVEGLDSRKIKQVCEYIAGNVPTKEEIASSGNSHAPCDATRILLQMVIFARGGSAAKQIERTYVKYLQLSAIERNEFLLFGTALCQLFKLYQTYGPVCFKSCELEIPFASLNCTPAKYGLCISTFSSLSDLANFWCMVVHIIVGDCYSSLEDNFSFAVVDVLVELSSFLVFSEATALTVVFICKALHTVAEADASLFHAQSPQLHASSGGFAGGVSNSIAASTCLVRWVQYAMSCIVQMNNQRSIVYEQRQAAEDIEVPLTRKAQLHSAIRHVKRTVLKLVQCLHFSLPCVNAATIDDSIRPTHQQSSHLSSPEVAQLLDHLWSILRVTFGQDVSMRNHLTAKYAEQLTYKGKGKGAVGAVDGGSGGISSSSSSSSSKSSYSVTASNSVGGAARNSAALALSSPGSYGQAPTGATGGGNQSHSSSPQELASIVAGELLELLASLYGTMTPTSSGCSRCNSSSAGADVGVDVSGTVPAFLELMQYGMDGRSTQAVHRLLRVFCCRCCSSCGCIQNSIQTGTKCNISGRVGSETDIMSEAVQCHILDVSKGLTDISYSSMEETHKLCMQVRTVNSVLGCCNVTCSCLLVAKLYLPSPLLQPM